ncbi:MAG TPA: hypothetical protein VMN99_08515, partial [Anaerolineales bacterium]|nr:hypothetical protein [Anaerolineales bacterium]
MDDNDTDLIPTEETDPQRRTIILAMTGVVSIGLCALFLIAFLWFQPDETSLFAQYFPSPTSTIRPTSTPAPTRTPAPNLTATELAWQRPAESPSLGTLEDAETALTAGVGYIENFALAYPDTPEVNQPGDVYIFEIFLAASEPLLWSYGWCSTTQGILEENFSHMRVEFLINGSPEPLSNFVVQNETQADDSRCRSFNGLVQQWPQGVHHLEVQVTF